MRADFSDLTGNTLFEFFVCAMPILQVVFMRQCELDPRFKGL